MLNVVCAALFDSAGRVLVQQRVESDPLAGLWEFPGGKGISGETEEQALARELMEELRIDADTTGMTYLGSSDGMAGSRSLRLSLYHCSIWRGEPVALSASALQWAFPNALYTLPMPDADIPLIPLLGLTGGWSNPTP